MKSSQELIEIIADPKKPADERVGSVRDLMHKNQDAIEAGIARTLPVGQIISVACTSIRKNPDLLECTPASLMAAVVEAGAYGLKCDGVMGEAYLVPFNDNKTQTKIAVMIPGYKGYRKLIRKGGVDVTMETVHAGDEYQFRGPRQWPHHKYSAHPKRRYECPVTHAFVVAEFGGDRVRAWSWTVEECLAHRDRYCKGWQRGKKKEEQPWNPANIHDFSVMCMKTVLLDAVHRGEFPLEEDERSLLQRDPAFAQIQAATIQPTAPPQSPVSAPPAIKLDFSAPAAVVSGRESYASTTAPVAESPSETKVEITEDGKTRVNNLKADLGACSEVLQCEKTAELALKECKLHGDNVDERAQMMELKEQRIEEIKGSRGAKSDPQKQN